MKLEINRGGFTGKPKAWITHNGETIEWNGSLFERTGMEVDDELIVFDQINGFWASLSKVHQDKIFEVYTRIRTVFDEVDDPNQLTQMLYKLVKELYDYHDLNDIRHWLDFHCTDVHTPPGLEDEFKESNETSWTRDRTYLKEDYRWLVAMSVALRVMYPVWGEFVFRTVGETGTVFKEYYAFKLLAYSNIYHSPPMEKLRIHIQQSIPAEKPKDSAILGGLSTEDFPLWILALVVVRRLTVGDLRGVDPKAHLVASIHKFINNKVKSQDNSFVGMVKPKLFEGAGQEGENNLSRLEGYKVKQDIPAGDIAIIEFSMRDVNGNALRLCPDIDLALVKQSMKSVSALESVQIQDPQIILMQWVLKPVIPARGLLHLNKHSILEAMAVTQAVLWHKGYYELAGLLSAIAQSNEDAMQMRGTETRARIPKDLLEQLDVLFPYYRRPAGKQKEKVGGKKPNVGVDAVDSITEMFREHDWKLTLPKEWLADWTTKVLGGGSHPWYSVPHDIKIKLATLAIAIAGRTF